MMIDKSFWSGKRVFLTGHTGFKGSWLCMLLNSMGANVTGYALTPPTNPSIFEVCRLEKEVNSIIDDIRDGAKLTAAMRAANPEIVIHMAAQPLVRESYAIPVETYEVNVMGTVKLLEAVRQCEGIKAVVSVTTDKCYENKEWVWGYRENDPMGGYDPYSSSKGCAELVTAAYRSSFFNEKDYSRHRVAVASARAGNVIGGGDWATDRLIPDCVKALVEGSPVRIRNPHAIRPWQHVLEPLSGYLLLAQHLYQNGIEYAEGWNFGPEDSDAKPVEWIVKSMCGKWGNGASYVVDKGDHPHEAHYLKLDCSKAKTKLRWKSRWDLEQALNSIIEWVRAYQSQADMREICLHQIEQYLHVKEV